jgi:hypothetical protein
MLPLTSTASAKADFIATRLNGVDTTSDPSKALLPIDQMQHSPQSKEEKKKLYVAKILSRWPYIFAGCLLFVMFVVGLCVWKCCCRKKLKKGGAAANVKAETQRDPDAGAVHGRQPNDLSYAPLHAQDAQYRHQGEKYGYV